MEKFVIKHYTDQAHPSLKGFGFDGLVIGEYRDEAEEFAEFLNSILEKCERAGIKIER